ncbi:SepM family pheromone-processing serine protease [Camelliibacillus cellulosilyticus]|uniref:endopeptidase La n=1 Tax=Camelliibacillus cellulosilyticus TaxID=2174486 RepID=A0ABV9GK46_9BACL
MRKNRSTLIYGLIIIFLIICIALNFVRMPYFVTQPGSADPLAPMIKVKNGYQQKGTLRLVTILEGQANFWQYLWAKIDFNPYTEVLKAQQITLPDETPKEMDVRQLDYMKDAQDKATYVAYKAAGKHPQISHQGVLVLNVNSKMPASKSLQAGDIIKAAEGQNVSGVKELESILKNKPKGSKVRLKIERSGHLKNVTAAIGQFPKEWLPANVKSKTGLGILESEALKVETQPTVKFNTKGIGGPSAGLMMALEIYNQLTPDDITKGYDICGTGEIDYDGKVGPIGGIKQKVVAADKAGAHIFFAPVADHEAADAKAAAKDIGTKMKIVPVKTFDDALKYLQSLKQKD